MQANSYSDRLDADSNIKSYKYEDISYIFKQILVVQITLDSLVKNIMSSVLEHRLIANLVVCSKVSQWNDPTQLGFHESSQAHYEN